MNCFIITIPKKFSSPEINLTTYNDFFKLITLSFRSLLYLADSFDNAYYLNSKYECLKTSMQLKLYEMKKTSKNNAKALEKEIVDNPLRLWDHFMIKPSDLVKKPQIKESKEDKINKQINQEIDEVMSLF